ncbi:unnamed protein product [Discula destructiva]
MSRCLRTGSLKSKMTSSQRSKQAQLTHFLCLPLVTPSSRPQLSAALADFKADVVRSRDLGGFALPPDAVRSVGTLHLTLGVMSFPNNIGLDRAVDMLQSLKPREMLTGVQTPAKSPGQEAALSEILLSLEGLKSMQNPGQATVLYAPPSDADGRLQGFAESIKAKFKDADAGLLVPDDRPLLLHATIVNTSYVKRDRRNAQKRERIYVQDAQALLDRYENHLWMEAVPLHKIAICKMSAKPVEENGVVIDAEYEVVAELDF